MVSAPDRQIPDLPLALVFLLRLAWTGEMKELPGSCREGHEGQRGALLWVVQVKTIGVVHLSRSRLD